jgi:hypothetical protein
MNEITNRDKNNFKWVGKNTQRPDGPDKVTGRARYGDDMIVPGMLHGKTLRSPHAHAKIISIDTSEAEALSGVKAVVTYKDIPDHPLLAPPYGPMITDFHEGVIPADICRRHPKGIYLAKNTQFFQQIFHIPGINFFHPVCHFLFKGIPFRGGIQGSRMHELIEQYRMLTQEGNDPGTFLGQDNQGVQGPLVFNEQRKIAGSALNGDDKIDQFGEQNLGVLFPARLFDQHGHEPGQFFPAIVSHSLGIGVTGKGS